MLTLTAQAQTNDEIRSLAKEKYKLTRQISKVFRANKLNEHEEYKAVNLQAYQASRAMITARRTHPALKELQKVSDVALGRMMKAMRAKDKAARKTASTEYSAARRALEAAARKIPELVSLQKKAIAANSKVKAKQKELLATIPEGKTIIDKINALDVKISALRKQLISK